MSSVLGGTGSSGYGSISEGATDDLQLTDREKLLRDKILRDLLGLPKEFKTWLTDWIAISGLPIGISQIQGFSGFTATPAVSVDTAQTTASTTYTNLETVGPTLTGLSDGSYLLLYSAVVDIPSGAGPVFASPKINATEAIDGDALETTVANRLTLMNYTFKTLANGGNSTVTMRYKVTGATTGSWRSRRLSALKYANP